MPEHGQVSRTTANEAPLTSRFIWDRTTRLFHWINVACVIALASLGLAILNAKSFGVSGEGKILLKTLHAYVGYAFAINLGWRLIWAFIGSRNARWSAIVPFRKGYAAELGKYVRGAVSGHPQRYLGHNPLGRLMVLLLLALMFSQAVTGLVLAGTDLYKPPFGGLIATWVTGGDSDKLRDLKPGSKEHVDPAAFAEMRSFREPFGNVHLYVFYVLMAAILLHVIGVIVAEVREKSGLVSAMITGRKLMRGTPADAGPSDQNTKG